MKYSWLAEFYRRWRAARGMRVEGLSRSFSVDWNKLLEAAGITRVEDQATAAREAEACGQLILKRHRYRKYIIHRVTLPLAAEPWLIERFGGTASEVLLSTSLAIIGEFAECGHPRFPSEWTALCESLYARFSQGRSLRPFYWNRPESLRQLLGGVRDLCQCEWPVGTLIREASVEIGYDSKRLERHQRTFESGLARLFGMEISLKSLGLLLGDSYVELHGPVCLHFKDGTVQRFDGLQNVFISSGDLHRCSSVSTTANRLLSIENRKTTFRKYAGLNADHRTLLAATSYPTEAFRSLLAKLPLSLPHDHFGDTDPAGWHILLKLREATPRRVSAHQMKWRQALTPQPLTPFDRKLLPKLLSSPRLFDVREQIELISQRQDRGDFEQETLELPLTLEG